MHTGKCVLVTAGLLTAALSAQAGSRVIVSTTLDSTLAIFDADSLAELQSPLPSKGGGPVRLWVQNFDGRDYLFAANHGAVLGSVGVFDLSGEQVMELPLSPFAARAGSVGIAAGELSVGATQVPTVFVTNTQSAAAAVAGLGCSLPNGSVTAYDASVLSTVGLLQEIGTVDVSAPIPYAVSVDPAGARAFASTNCGDTLDTLAVTGSGADGSGLVLTRTATRSTGASPDGTIYDGAWGLNYTANIGGDSLSVHDAQSPDALLTVDLAGAGPIDVTIGNSPGGHHWVITANGSDGARSLSRGGRSSRPADAPTWPACSTAPSRTTGPAGRRASSAGAAARGAAPVTAGSCPRIRPPSSGSKAPRPTDTSPGRSTS